MKIKPMFDNLLIKRNENQEKTTSGGIILPGNSSQEKPLHGTVVAIGNGNRDEKGNIIPLTLKEGENVIFSKYSGTEVEVEGSKFLIVKEKDIIAVIC